jgi:NADH dehydrogenase FAD-containing subunit
MAATNYGKMTIFIPWVHPSTKREEIAEIFNSQLKWGKIADIRMRFKKAKYDENGKCLCLDGNQAFIDIKKVTLKGKQMQVRMKLMRTLMRVDFKDNYWKMTLRNCQ